MKNFIKSTKGKITIGILCVLAIVIGALGFTEYTKYQELIKSTIVFKEVTEIGLSEDLMTLIDTYDADAVAVNRIVDSTNKVVDSPTASNYTIVFEAVSNGHATEFRKDITFFDDKAPEIIGAADKEIDYAAELDLIEGITAEDNVDGTVEVTSSLFNNKLVGIQPVEYTAKDAAGNETTLMINITVKEPACTANATWNGEDCVCDSGYTGDGWSSCVVVKKATSSTSGGKTTTSSNGSSSSSSSQSSASNSGTSGSSGSNGWSIDSPTHEMEQNLWNTGKDIYGEGNSWGGWVTSDGTMIFD